MAVVIALVLVLLPAWAEDKVDDALAKATQYLISAQDPETGGIHNKMRHETAMTSLSLLALTVLTASVRPREAVTSR